MGYTSFCSSVISEHRLTVDVRGDIEELADFLAADLGILTVVDHDARQLKLLEGPTA
jgi:hypothetical protein